MGNLPVTVIARRITENAAANSGPLAEQDWLRGQKALVGRSSNSTFVMAQTDLHDIQFHEPELIVSNVRKMVESVRPVRPPMAP